MTQVKVRCSIEKIKTILSIHSYTDKELMDGTVKGSKVYYKGSGWWLVSGYAADGHDVTDLLSKLQ